MPSQNKTLYVSRRLLQPEKLIQWADQQGFKSIVGPEHLPVTVIFSKTAVDWSKLTPVETTITNRSPIRSVIPLGDKGAIVLRFESAKLTKRHQALVKAGAKSDFPTFKPHLTLTYEGHIDPSDIDPFEGPLHFGPEVFREVDEDWSDKIEEKKL